MVLSINTDAQNNSKYQASQAATNEANQEFVAWFGWILVILNALIESLKGQCGRGKVMATFAHTIGLGQFITIKRKTFVRPFFRNALKSTNNKLTLGEFDWIWNWRVLLWLVIRVERGMGRKMVMNEAAGWECGKDVRSGVRLGFGRRLVGRVRCENKKDEE